MIHTFPKNLIYNNSLNKMDFISRGKKCTALCRESSHIY